MPLFRIPSLLEFTYVCAACLGGYWLYWELITGRRYRQLIKKHGCRPARRFKNRDPILGLDFFFNACQWIKKNVFLETLQTTLFPLGINTVEVNIFRYFAIFSCEAENIKAALSVNFKSFGLVDLPKELDLLLKDGIFTHEGSAWHHSRELLRPSFARTNVADLAMLKTHAGRLLEKIPLDGSTVDLSELFSHYTLSVAVDFLFGDSGFESHHDPEMGTNEDFARLWHRLSLYLGGGGYQGKFWLWHFFLDRIRINPQIKRDCQRVHEFVDRLIEKSLSAKQPTYLSTSTGRPRHLFLQDLASQTNDRKRIRTESLAVLFAGRDTTAALLTNVFFHLSKRPDIWTRLREEIDTLNGEKPSYEELKNLKYLRAVLNETLRLCPVVPALGRTAREDVILPTGGGEDGKSPLLVKKGQIFIFSTYSMHRRKDIYGEDADVFKPERWLDTPGQKGCRISWEYLPFSGGPRVCIGQNFALTSTSYLTTRLIQSFPGPLESRDPEPWRESLRVVCSSKGGCKVALSPARM